MKVHDKEWFQKMNHEATWFTIMAARSIESNDGEVDGCTVCGDKPAKEYELPSKPSMPHVLLCDDCLQIQADIHEHHFKEIKP